MAWWNPFSRTAAAEAPSHPSPDLTDFERATWALDSLSVGDLIHLGAYGAGCRADTPPEQVPAQVLDAIGHHPVVYAGESVVAGPSHDPELFFLRHLRGPETVVAETEAWLRPLLALQRAPLLPQITRAFGFGAIPIVLDYGVEDLSIKVPGEGEKERAKNFPGHVHYVSSHELFPGDVQLRVRADKLVGLIDTATGLEYGGEDLEDAGQARGFLALWDPKFGDWKGQGSRRRVYRDWFEEAHTRLWEMRYVEKSVDLARVGYAPDGDITINGVKTPAIKLLRAQIMALRNGSVITLPSTLQGDGEPSWKVDTLKGEDRQQIFGRVIDARAARMLWAAMIPGGKVDKATEETTMDSVQRVADFTAQTLTRIANTALRQRYGKGVALVQVLANDVPKRKLRLVQQVFSNVCNAVQRTKDGKTYTLSELVHPEIIDHMGIKARPVAEAAHAPVAGPPAGGPPGRPIDVGSKREERRDDAEKIEGEEDTGGEDQEREERAQ